jgi:hypothetical protein
VFTTSAIQPPSTGDAGLNATSSDDNRRDVLEAGAIGVLASVIALGWLALIRRTQR